MLSIKETRRKNNYLIFFCFVTYKKVYIHLFTCVPLNVKLKENVIHFCMISYLILQKYLKATPRDEINNDILVISKLKTS